MPHEIYIVLCAVPSDPRVVCAQKSRCSGWDVLRCTEMRSFLGWRVLMTNRDVFRAGVKDVGVPVSTLKDAGAETVKQTRFPWGE